MRTSIALASVPLVAFLAGCGGRNVDRSFDVSVAEPAFHGNGPRVLFDEAHHEHHRAHGTYAPFVRLLENDGFRVRVNRAPLEATSLRGCDILAVVTATGPDPVGDQPAFTPAECLAIREWLEGGGALLLVFDHYPYGDAAQTLADRFGVNLGRGSVEDPQVHAGESTGQLVFTRENGLLGEHAILRGRRPQESVSRLMTFDGASVSVPAGAVALLPLSPTAVDLQPNVVVDRSGGNVRVNVTFTSPSPATGRAQGAALEAGKGRVVILGEAAMLTAQRKDGQTIGMNVAGIDNRQFALNVARWLAHAI